MAEDDLQRSATPATAPATALLQHKRQTKTEDDFVKTNGTAEDQHLLDENPEQLALGENYSSQLVVLKELFSDWTQDDLIFALSESDGDLDTTISRISEGHAAKWGEVKQQQQQQEKTTTTQPMSTKDKIKQKVSDIADKITGGGGGGAATEHQHPRPRTSSGRGGRGSRPAGRGGSVRTAVAASGGRGGGRAEVPVPIDAAAPKDSWAEQTPTSWGDSEMPPTKSKQPHKQVAKSSWGPRKQQQQPQPQQPQQQQSQDKPLTPATTDWGKQGGASTKSKTAAAQTKPSSVIPSGAKSSWASIVKPDLQQASQQQAAYVDAGAAKNDSLAAAGAAAPASRRVKPSVRLPNSADKRVPLTEGNLEAFEQTLPSNGKRRPSQSAAATEATNRDSARSALLDQSQVAYEKQGSMLAGGRQQQQQQPQPQPQPYQRRFNQDGPVIMPESNNNNTTTGIAGIERASVQFGSLNLNGAQPDEQIYQGATFKSNDLQKPTSGVADLGRQPSDQQQHQQLPTQQQQQQQQQQPQYPFHQASAASFGSPYSEAPKNAAAATDYKPAQQPQSYGQQQPNYPYDYGNQQSQSSYGNVPDYAGYYGASETQQPRSHNAFYDQSYQQPQSSLSNRGGTSSVTSEQQSSRLAHSGEMTPATTASAGTYTPAGQQYANPYGQAGTGPHGGPTNHAPQGGHQNYPMQAYYQPPYAYYQNMVCFQ